MYPVHKRLNTPWNEKLGMGQRMRLALLHILEFFIVATSGYPLEELDDISPVRALEGTSLMLHCPPGLILTGPVFYMHEEWRMGTRS